MPPLVGRLFLLLMLAVDWYADPALLAPSLCLLAKPWCSTENVCPSCGYQQEVLRQSRPDHDTSGPVPAADIAPLESASSRDVARMPPALNPVRHLYVFMSLRR
jgi:hypothetical protein